MRWNAIPPMLVLALFFFGILRASGVDPQASSPQTTDSVAPSQSSTMLRANTRLVVIEAVVTDRNGQLVTDLKPEDFTVLEDGKAQKVSGFFFQRGLSAPVTRAQLPVNVVTNSPQFQSGTLNVILFDVGNGDFAEHAYAKDQLLKFLNSAELGRPVAIFAMQDQLKLLSDFTTDNKALVAAVTRYKPPAGPLNIESMESRVSAFGSEAAFHTSEKSIENTLDELDLLAKTLSGYPGRKNLIWLSEGFPLSLFPETTLRAGMDAQSLRSVEGNGGAPSTFENLQTARPFKSYAASVKKITDELMGAQIAVYTVDAGALGKDSHLTAQHTMEEIAQGTGGKAFVNSNDLSLNLKTSMEDGSTFYTLSYYPENKTWNGEFRSVQIKASRPGLTLRYRLGYYALDPEKVNQEDAKTIAENFGRSMQLESPASTAVIFQAQVAPPSDKNKKVVVTFHVDPKTIAFAQQNDGEEYARISCVVWAFGKDKEKPAIFSGTTTANLKPAEFQQVVQQHFLPCNRELDLNPGTYTLRLGVLDRSSNKIGTANATVAVQ